MGIGDRLKRIFFKHAMDAMIEATKETFEVAKEYLPCKGFHDTLDVAEECIVDTIEDKKNTIIVEEDNTVVETVVYRSPIYFFDENGNRKYE